MPKKLIFAFVTSSSGAPTLFSASMLSKDQRFPAHARNELESIAYNVQVEARLIDDLLDVARVTGESGTGQSGAEAQMVPAPEWNQDGPKRRQILLVDDHRDTAEALRNYLGRAGYDVTVAPSIEVACHCVERQQFDLLLCDIGLPDGRGDELLRKLRKAGHGLPAIAISGFGAETDVARSRAAGFHTHLTKPFSPQQLMRTVEEALGGAA